MSQANHSELGEDVTRQSDLDVSVRDASVRVFMQAAPKTVSSWQEDHGRDRAGQINVMAPTVRLAPPHTTEHIESLRNVRQGDDRQADGAQPLNQ